MIANGQLQPDVGSVGPVVIAHSGNGIHRGEDVCVVEVNRAWPGLADPSFAGSSDSVTQASSTEPASRPRQYSLFAVFDGHNGNMAAQLAGNKTLGLLEDRLPWGAPPADGDDSDSAAQWRGAVQRALVETLVELNWLFAGHGMTAGCTATLVLQTGWLLTVANIGDSRALLDYGADTLLLTEDHRVASHKGERRRLEAANARVAPIHVSGQGPAASAEDGIGPLRVWPGGLCLSRAVGDFDVGKAILPFPHVKQVRVPREGARVILASDGLWDAFEADKKVATLSRSWTPEAAPTKLINTVIAVHDRLRDDTTVVVVDLLPPHGASTFAEVCAPYSMMAAMRRGGARIASSDAVGCFGCFGGSRKKTSIEQETSKPTSSPDPSTRYRPKPVCTVLADADTAALVGLMTAGWDDPGRGIAWCDDEIARELRRVAEASWVEWRRAAACRFKGLYVPEPEESSRWRRGERLLESAEANEQTTGKEEGEEGSGMKRSVSMFFRQNVATDQSDYAARFGHYKTDIAAGPRHIPRPTQQHRGEGSGSGTSTRVRTSYLEAAAAEQDDEEANATTEGSHRVRYQASSALQTHESSESRGVAPSDISVRVAGFKNNSTSNSNDSALEEDEEVAAQMAQRTNSENPRVRLGRQDSVSEVPPAASSSRSSGHATVRFADRPVEILHQPAIRVVHRGTSSPLEVPSSETPEPGMSGSIASVSPEGLAILPASGESTPEGLATPDLDMDGRASKHRLLPVELET